MEERRQVCYPQLRAMMAAHGVTARELSAKIGISNHLVSLKLNEWQGCQFSASEQWEIARVLSRLEGRDLTEQELFEDWRAKP